MILALILTAAFSLIQASHIIVTNSQPTVSFPVRFAYINSIRDWSSAKGIAKSIGLPGYAPAHNYNYVCLTFWTAQLGPLDAALLWNNSLTYFGSGTFGSTSAAIRANIKQIFNSNGVKLMVSAFGATETPTSSGFNATDCALRLADFVISNNLDGVDVDWQDTSAFQNGIGQAWLITFTTVLRSKLPDAIITHAPQAPYFGGTALYPKNGYLAIDQAVGSMIQFYNVQFYNQGSTPYNTSAGLFNSSGGWAAGTSVNEIIAKGVSGSKIVVGKPATPADGGAGYMSGGSIGDALVANYRFNGWMAGVMFWQYSSDHNGTICAAAISPLLNAISSTNSIKNATNTTTTNTTNTTNTPNTTNTTSSNNTNTTNTTNTTNSTSNTNSNINISYPIRFAYINKISDWSTANGLARSLGVPGYAPAHIYNYICLSYWTNSYGPVDASLLWDNPTSYFGTRSQFGSNDTAIRANIKQIYTSKGIKLMLGVFGSIDLPSTYNVNPTVCATAVATYAKKYSYDGIDVNWYDLYSFMQGKGQAWLTNFTSTFRSLAPTLIITHSAFSSYFSTSFAKGGYMTIHQQVGSFISFYNVLYYNQYSSKVVLSTTANSLFNVSGGSYPKTSVSQLIARGIPGNKIVVGKPASASSTEGASFISAATLGQSIVTQYKYNKWYTGVMLWQYSSDPNGTMIQTIMSSFRSNYSSLFK